MLETSPVKSGIQKVLISRNDGKSIEIDNSFIIKFEYTQTIGNLTTSAELIIQDYYGFLSENPLGINDRVIVTWCTGDEPSSEECVSKEFIIYDLEYRIFETLTQNLLTLKLTDTWSIDFLTKPTKRFWKQKKSSEIIRDVLSSCDVVYHFIEETNEIFESFVPPCWSPNLIIRYLLGRSSSERTKTSNWLQFITTKMGAIICTKETLLEYNQYWFSERYLEEIEILSANKIYYGKTYLTHLSNLIDSIMLYNGAFYVESDLYHTDSNSLVKVFEDRPQTISSVNKASFIPLVDVKNDTLIRKDYSDNTLFPQSISKFLQWNRNSLSRDIFERSGYLVRLPVVTNFHAKREPGLLVKLKIKKLPKEEQKIEESLTGEYLIESITSVFSTGAPYQILSLISEGLFYSRREDFLKR